MTEMAESVISWLLEHDEKNPGVRWYALRELLDRTDSDPEVVEAKRLIMETGPVPEILAQQHPEGYWVRPGPGYNPKYRATQWQVIFLAQLGADGSDTRVCAACEHLLEQAVAPWGGFSANAKAGGRYHCLQGNLVAALNRFGYLGDERHELALEWLARSITGEGIAPAGDQAAGPQYLRSGNCGPGFRCGYNGQLPCAWGAIKAMLALSGVPVTRRSPMIERAIGIGVDFLLSRDPAVADYPMARGAKPSRNWFRFGYPIGYSTDVLQNLEALTALGCGGDPRLANAVDLVLSKQGEDGRWTMEHSYNGKTWVDVESFREPSKWVTLRALRVLKRVREQTQVEGQP